MHKQLNCNTLFLFVFLTIFLASSVVFAKHLYMKPMKFAEAENAIL